MFDEILPAYRKLLRYEVSIRVIGRICERAKKWKDFHLKSGLAHWD